MGARKIKHRGKEILYLDFRNMDQKGIIEDLESMTKLVLDENKPFVFVTDLHDTYATTAVMEAAYVFGKKTKHLLTKSAITGVSGAKTILLKAYNRITNSSTRTFDTAEEAFDYLSEN